MSQELVKATKSFLKQWHDVKPTLRALVEHKRIFDPTFRMPPFYLEILALENALEIENALEKEEQK